MSKDNLLDPNVKGNSPPAAAHSVPSLAPLGDSAVVGSGRKTGFEVISLDLIDDPVRPLRSDLSPESVAELVASIRQWGVIEPLVVRRKGERFEVIAGHRRLVSAGIADLAQVPCYIINVSDEEAEFVKIHENLYRQEISPSDQAEHFSYLIQRLKLTPAKIARLIQKSETFVSERLQILSYPPELKEAMDSGLIKFSVAREFYRIKEMDKLREYLGYAVRSGIVPSLARKWVDDYLRPLQVITPVEGAVQNQGEEPVYPEQQTTCIYCTEALKLGDAAIVYMHPDCLTRVTQN